MPGKVLAEKCTGEKSVGDLIVACDEYLDGFMDPALQGPGFRIRSGVLEEAAWMQAKALLMIAGELILMNEMNRDAR